MFRTNVSLYQALDVQARLAALAAWAFPLMEVRAVCPVAKSAQIAIIQATGADQNPDVLHVVRAGSVGAGDQHLIVSVDVAKLAV
ncbi:hypothetical protein [Phaeobacter gallaeciensis]|uniref:hypothetical protein n=1 Tax=Phaeobacter gallaeciensis TaxID=60890 RepID=UPI0015F07F98|nr:hypothetical protein [Phaeobacter gallaeciensis]